MTNITLSIEEGVYKRMKQWPEIKWSEFVRKSIAKRLEELETIENHPHKESIYTMLASESVLREEWDNTYDEQWDTV